jgi:hypothetical protein
LSIHKEPNNVRPIERYVMIAWSGEHEFDQIRDRQNACGWFADIGGSALAAGAMTVSQRSGRNSKLPSARATRRPYRR